MPPSTMRNLADRIRGLPSSERMWLLREMPKIAIRVKDEARLLRLTIPDFIHANIEADFAEDLLRNLQDGYLALKECSEPSSRLFLSRILDLLVVSEQTPGAPFTLEYVDSRMSYRFNREFYTDLLRCAVMDEWRPPSGSAGYSLFAVKSKAFYGNLCRRRGDLAAAKQYLPDSIKYAHALGDLKSLATFEYEMATVFLRSGELGRAIHQFKQSARHANRAGDELGEWIGRCLEFRVRFLDDQEKAADFKTVLSQAREVFTRIDQTSAPNSRERNRAESWLMSVNLHRFEIAFAQADNVAAENAIAQLRSDRWLKNNGRDVLLIMCEARLAFMKHNWLDAISWFVAYLDIDLSGWGERNPSNVAWALERHEIAEDYLLLGEAFEALSEQDNAQKAWFRGMDCPSENGNGMFKPRIRACLARQGCA